ncbi:unnamed protein product [Staurois parvus]|uniref:Uncharacterized protein n=1 Tax=Staurois parvus TaxID=386267 RepID=A0ABN9HB44_9NEOB|nr:unnamed protein product [Staurois parvus]
MIGTLHRGPVQRSVYHFGLCVLRIVVLCAPRECAQSTIQNGGCHL